MINIFYFMIRYNFGLIYQEQSFEIEFENNVKYGKIKKPIQFIANQTFRVHHVKYFHAMFFYDLYIIAHFIFSTIIYEFSFKEIITSISVLEMMKTFLENAFSILGSNALTRMSKLQQIIYRRLLWHISN